MAINTDIRYSMFNSRKSRGFALLIAVIFMSVMLSFGLTLGALAYKQQILASSALESQYAFYAADAALECALYADQQQNLFMYPPPPGGSSAPAPSFYCANTLASSNVPLYSTNPTQQWVLSYRLTLDNNTHCADVTVYKPASGVTYLFARGYNVSCTTVANPNGARFSARGIQVHY